MEDKKETPTLPLSDPLPTQAPLAPIKETDHSLDENISVPKDELLEQINVLAIKMDIHKNGILYLKESVRLL